MDKETEKENESSSLITNADKWHRVEVLEAKNAKGACTKKELEELQNLLDLIYKAEQRSVKWS